MSMKGAMRRIRRANMSDPYTRFRMGLGVLAATTAAGTVGYRILGLSWLDAVYQTGITISTVGYAEVGDVDREWKIFTLLLILFGVGTSLYTLSVLLETFVEGLLTDEIRRRRMSRRIDALDGHVIVCGWGQVGEAISHYISAQGQDVVVIDRDGTLAGKANYIFLEGDATEDEILLSAGLHKASTLISALDHDADNLFVTLTARSLRPDLTIVSRSVEQSATRKLLQAGADRVVNPHEIGGSRMAALAMHEHVAEFLDMMVHDTDATVRLDQAIVPEGSAFAGLTLSECAIRSRTGAMVIAVGGPHGGYRTNPPADLRLDVGDVIIAFGSNEQTEALRAAAEEQA